MTHNERVLALLSDGEPHSHRELYGLYVIAHSRISDLRKRGHSISMWREGDDYMYQLCPEEPCAPSPRLTADSLAESDAADAHPSVSSGQLVLGTA